MREPAAARIRVLTFGRFADEDFGGLERYVFELAQALRDEVHFTNIVASRGAAPDVPVTGDVVYARPIGTLGGAPVCPAMLFDSRRLHRERPFDIVHLQFPADPMAHAATAALPASVRRVITWHSDVVRQKGLLGFYRPFLNRLLESAHAIILPTPAHRAASQQLDAVRDQSRFHVVPFGFDLARFAERPAGADRIRERHRGRLLVFALGRHVYYKGFEFLIRALARVPDAALVLGGRGPLTGELEKLARDLGVSPRVDFVGRIPESELPAYYHACDVFCMPSVERAEAFGIVQVEAMACARPVVCCELGNGVNWVSRHGETGLAVPPRDADALAAALTQIRDDRALGTRLGEQGRRRALTHFDAGALRAGTLAVYRQVLGR